MNPGKEYSPEDFRDAADNIYEAILVIAKRARQVGELQKRQIDRYLGQTEMAEQAAAQARAEDSEDAAVPIEPEPVKPAGIQIREACLGIVSRNEG